MKLKQLESLLSEVSSFENPKIEYEQIPTPCHIAARMIYVAATTYGDITDKHIGDFGSGPGILSIASSIMGCSSVVGFDADADAIENCWVNMHKLEITNMDMINIDIQSVSLKNKFDTIIMNPPFGTRNAGIDTIFLTKGLENANVVYSLHKSSTRDHFIKYAELNNCNIEVIAELKYDIPKMFKYHKEKSKDINVDLYRFTHKTTSA